MVMDIDINPHHVSITGTSLQGYLDIKFADLQEALGDPITPVGGDGKVICEWILFDKHTEVVATIYVYKVSQVPLELYSWHIGGRSDAAIELVKRVFPNHVAKFCRP
jgi:hypothetical protein